MAPRASIPELHHRLIDALLRPVVAVARHFRVPISEVERLCRLAYYRELRRGTNITQAEVARVFGKSLRTVVGVERQLRSDYLAPEAAVELSRRIEEVLTGGPHTLDALTAAIGGADETEVERAVVALTTVGRVRTHMGKESDEPSYSLQERFQSLVKGDLLARIDGLVHQLEVLGSAVRARFYGNGDTRPTVARTLAFVGRAPDVERMCRELVRELRMQAIDVEEAALREGGRQRYGVTFAIAPLDPQDTNEGGQNRNEEIS